MDEKSICDSPIILARIPVSRIVLRFGQFCQSAVRPRRVVHCREVLALPDDKLHRKRRAVVDGIGVLFEHDASWLFRCGVVRLPADLVNAHVRLRRLHA